jgi:hypothetical protein
MIGEEAQNPYPKGSGKVLISTISHFLGGSIFKK